MTTMPLRTSTLAPWLEAFSRAGLTAGPIQTLKDMAADPQAWENDYFLKVPCSEVDREVEILHARAPEASEALSREVVAFVQHLRTEDLFKKPGVAETIDWAKCLLALDVINLSPEVIADTLGAILKYQDDIAKLQNSEATRILDQAKASLEPA